MTELPRLTSFGERRAALISRGRKWISIAAFLALAAPLIVGLVAPDDPATIFKEGRKPAPPPNPHTFTDWMWFPTSVDAYLKDHFGLRQAMIGLNHELSQFVSWVAADPRVLIGRDGRMFYLDDEMVVQSAGRVLRRAEVVKSADLIAAMRTALAARGASFLVAIPPNSSTIYQDDLPPWAQNPGLITEYDLVLDELRKRGVKAVDLRPALKLAREQGEAYLRYDTHWTPRGAIAGFNAAIEADGRPDWRIDPQTALGPPIPRKFGDLARILGAHDKETEMVEWFAFSPRGTDQPITQEPMPDHVFATGKPGPTVMVIGDSFTHFYFTTLLSQHWERVVWINRRGCGFDWNLIDRFHPDEVWWAPTERFLICDPGVRPANFPNSFDLHEVNSKLGGAETDARAASVGPAALQ